MAEFSLKDTLIGGGILFGIGVFIKKVKGKKQVEDDSQDWGGDPDGQLAKALAKVREESKKPREPLKIERLDAEKESKSDCPPATKDVAINTKNRNATIKNYGYGPLNVEEPADFWKDIAKQWKTTEKAAKKSKCGNCVAFDRSPRMKDCMPGETSDGEGVLGYCWMHHFKCHSARTCDTWAKGGPITTDKVSEGWGERAFPKMEMKGGGHMDFGSETFNAIEVAESFNAEDSPPIEYPQYRRRINYLEMIYNAFYDPESSIYQVVNGQSSGAISYGEGFIQPAQAIFFDLRNGSSQLDGQRLSFRYGGNRGSRYKLETNVKNALQRASGTKLSSSGRLHHGGLISADYEYNGKMFFVRYNMRGRGSSRRTTLSVASQDSIPEYRRGDYPFSRAYEHENDYKYQGGAESDEKREVQKYRIGDMKVREYDDGTLERYEAQRIQYDYMVHREPRGTEVDDDGNRIKNPRGGRFTSADAETFGVCPCGCNGKIEYHDDRGYGCWECARCGEDSDGDMGEDCSYCVKMLDMEDNPQNYPSYQAETFESETVAFESFAGRWNVGASREIEGVRVKKMRNGAFKLDFQGESIIIYDGQFYQINRNARGGFSMGRYDSALNGELLRSGYSEKDIPDNMEAIIRWKHRVGGGRLVIRSPFKKARHIFAGGLYSFTLPGQGYSGVFYPTNRGKTYRFIRRNGEPIVGRFPKKNEAWLDIRYDAETLGAETFEAQDCGWCGDKIVGGGTREGEKVCSACVVAYDKENNRGSPCVVCDEKTEMGAYSYGKGGWVSICSKDCELDYDDYEAESFESETVAFESFAGRWNVGQTKEIEGVQLTKLTSGRNAGFRMEYDGHVGEIIANDERRNGGFFVFEGGGLGTGGRYDGISAKDQRECLIRWKHKVGGGTLVIRRPFKKARAIRTSSGFRPYSGVYKPITAFVSKAYTFRRKSDGRTVMGKKPQKNEEWLGIRYDAETLGAEEVNGGYNDCCSSENITVYHWNGANYHDDDKELSYYPAECRVCGVEYDAGLSMYGNSSSIQDLEVSALGAETFDAESKLCESCNQTGNKFYGNTCSKCVYGDQEWCSNCGGMDCKKMPDGDWYCMNFLNNRETYDGRYDAETFESDDDWADEGIDPTIVGYCYDCNTVKPNYGNCKCVDDSMTAESFSAETFLANEMPFKSFWLVAKKGSKSFPAGQVGELRVYENGERTIVLDNNLIIPFYNQDLAYAYLNEHFMVYPKKGTADKGMLMRAEGDHDDHDHDHEDIDELIEKINRVTDFAITFIHDGGFGGEPKGIIIDEELGLKTEIVNYVEGSIDLRLVRDLETNELVSVRFALTGDPDETPILYLPLPERLTTVPEEERSVKES